MIDTRHSTNSTQMHDSPETTKEKIARLFKPNTLARIEIEGLTVVDKHDLQTTIESYNTTMDENKQLRERLARLEGGNER